MYTVLTKGTGERVYYPNTRMLNLPIANLSRTQHKADVAGFTVDAGACAVAAREAIIVSALSLCMYVVCLQGQRQHNVPMCSRVCTHTRTYT